MRWMYAVLSVYMLTLLRRVIHPKYCRRRNGILIYNNMTMCPPGCVIAINIVCCCCTNSRYSCCRWLCEAQHSSGVGWRRRRRVYCSAVSLFCCWGSAQSASIQLMVHCLCVCVCVHTSSCFSPYNKPLLSFLSFLHTTNCLSSWQRKRRLGSTAAQRRHWETNEENDQLYNNNNNDTKI